MRFTFSIFIYSSQHETKLYAQIKEAETNAINCQTKVNDLSYKLTELERDISLKNWNIERKYTRMHTDFA